MAPDHDPFAQREWRLARGRALALGPRAVIMAIVNVTPDSFSDGGLLPSVDAAVEAALRMEAEGADILDIGGESTRPGADPVSAEEEQRRVLPVIEALAARTQALISVDTYRAETARLALAAGAHIVNDVWGFQRDPPIAAVAAESEGRRGDHAHRPRARSARRRRCGPACLPRQVARDCALGRAAGQRAGARSRASALPRPTDENLDLMARFAELHGFGLPLLAGTSRKRFVGAVSGRSEADRRDAATAATSVVLRMAGAAIFRVHDVAINKDALAVADAMVSRMHPAEPESP